MSDQITVARVQSYGRNVFHLSQRRGSKLLQFCEQETVNAKRHYFDRVGLIEASIKSGRHTPTPLSEVPHSRRAVDLVDYHVADAIDHEDRIRMLWDPAGKYQQAMMWGLGRKIDAEIIEGLTGSAKTGEDGSGSATLASFESGSQVIANGGTGLTVAKLRQAYRVFEQNDVDLESSPLIAVISPIAQEQLLADVQVTSRDFTMNNVLADGTIDGKKFMGMRFIVHTGLDVASSIRTCIIFKSMTAVAAAIGQRPECFIDRRPDLSQAVQVYCRMSCDAVRLEEAQVVTVDVDETV